MLPPSEHPLVDELGLSDDEQDDYHDALFLGAVPEGKNHVLLGWPSALTFHALKKRRFLAQFDSDRKLALDMGSQSTLRFYVSGDRVDEATLKTAVCTLTEG